MPVSYLAPVRSGALAALLLPMSLMAMERPADADAHPRFLGPLASGGQPLPKGMLNVEPYLVTTLSKTGFDGDGHRRSNDAPAQLDVLVPIKYGVTDRLTLGTTLSGQYDRGPRGGRDVVLGDTSLSAQYALYSGGGAHRAAWAATAQRGLPTGHHDRLQYARHAGSGSGALTTGLSTQGQAYFLDGMLRARVDAGWRLPASHAGIHGKSVYGTAAGFTGWARLGSTFNSSVAAEYSVHPQWTLVAEALYERDRGTRVRGTLADGTALDRQDPASWRLSVLPAVEYHFNDQVGIIGGIQLGVAGRNTAAIIAPQVAVNVAF